VQSLEAVESADISVRDWRVQDMRPSSLREGSAKRELPEPLE
jgi:hypothetical protein